MGRSILKHSSASSPPPSWTQRRTKRVAAAACSSAPPAGKTKSPFTDERLQGVKGFCFVFLCHISLLSYLYFFNPGLSEGTSDSQSRKQLQERSKCISSSALQIWEGCAADSKPLRLLTHQFNFCKCEYLQKNRHHYYQNILERQNLHIRGPEKKN